jgi:MHS family shikimate/dehydroshikimate transporter-like MFS transporter
VGYGVGLLLSTGLVSLISQLTTDEQFLSWGWRIPFIFSIVLVIAALWVRNGMEESAEFEKQQQEKPVVKKRLPVMEALIQHPGAFLKIIALRLCELLTMYIVTAFALNYSTQNLGLPRELFLNIGLLVGGISCLTIPCFAWLADRFGRRRVYITGALIGTLSAWPFFMALEAQSVFWIVFFAIMLANIAHDMVVCVQQPMFTELFGAAIATAVLAWVSGGERGGRWVYPVYCRRAGDLSGVTGTAWQFICWVAAWFQRQQPC